jgi:TPR repeat protein
MKALLSTITLCFVCLLSVYANPSAKRDFNTLDSVEKQKVMLTAAKRMLYGVNGAKLDYRKAHKIFLVLAAQGNADAMFNLGMMYRRGMGCPKSERMAYKYLVAAAQKNHAKATYNLGMLCKYGDSIPQNYRHSAAWVKKAVDLGFKGAHYTLGYSYYKGLGVPQSYKLAVEQFKLAAESKDAAGTFMLGYCYLNGYGVERDVQNGKHFIKKSAKMGHDMAIAFMENEEDPESYSEAKNKRNRNKLTKSAAQVDAIDRYIPQQRIVVSNNVYSSNGKLAAGVKSKSKLLKSSDDLYTPLNESIEGIWSGKLVVYDWSQRQIVEKKMVTLSLKDSGNELTGTWSGEDEEPVEIKAKLKDSIWVFERTLVQKSAKELSLRIGQLRWVKNSEDELLLGNLLLYANQLKEPARPNMLVLVKEKQNEEAASNAEKQEELKQELPSNNSIKVYPNPFSYELNLELTIATSNKLSIRIYDAGGVQVYSGAEKWYESGVHKERISVALSSGAYMVRMSGAEVNVTSWVVKY